MVAFRQLPFQFQQRGVDLAQAVQDGAKMARYHEARDQDLENYLAGLGGARVSVAAWLGTNFVGGGDTLTSSFQNVEYATVFVTDGGFSGSAGSVVWDGDPSAWCLLSITNLIVPDATCLPGLAHVESLQTGQQDMIVNNPGGGAQGSLTQQRTGLGITSAAVGALNGNLFEQLQFVGWDLDLQTSTGTLTVPDVLLLASSQVTLYVVD